MAAILRSQEHFPPSHDGSRDYHETNMSNTTTALLAAATLAPAPAKAAVDMAAVDLALEALKTYNHGSSRATLMPIDDAVVASLRDVPARKELERRLAAVLRTNVSPVAKDYLCSKLSLIGSAESVPALAELLSDQNLAHPARNALEAMPGLEPVNALRDSLARLAGLQKAGVINSLGTRRDVRSVPLLTTLLEDGDSQIAGAAAAALGNIGTVETAQALQKFQPKASVALRLVVADASLACAERLLADGNKAEALAIYKALTDARQPKQVQLAARQGLLTAAQKK